ncbi:sensor histidine kinase [Saltatorellus ferox]
MQLAALPILTSAAALVAAGLWQAHDFEAHRAEHLASHQERGAIIVAAIQGAAAREFRGNRYQPGSLATTLEEALGQFDLEWLSISTSDGTLVATAGQPMPGADPLHQFEGRITPIQPRDPSRRPPMGDHAGTMAVVGTPLHLTLQVDAAPFNRRLASDRTRFAMSSALIALAIGLFGAIFWIRLRAQHLRSQLMNERLEVESLERLRRVGAGLVHETKNPLSVVRGLAQRITRTSLDAERLQATARAIVEETDRTVARLDEFLLFSRPATLRRARFAVRPLFEELAELIEPEIEAEGASLHVECSGIEIDADREQLRRLFLNLLLNAARAAEPGGNLWIGCRRVEGRLQLVVEDDGPGVPEEIESTLFEPYVSAAEGGSGLGLSIASRIALDHGFLLRHERRYPRGARMVLEVPEP